MWGKIFWVHKFFKNPFAHQSPVPCFIVIKGGGLQGHLGTLQFSGGGERSGSFGVGEWVGDGGGRGGQWAHLLPCTPAGLVWKGSLCALLCYSATLWNACYQRVFTFCIFTFICVRSQLSSEEVVTVWTDCWTGNGSPKVLEAPVQVGPQLSKWVRAVCNSHYYYCSSLPGARFDQFYSRFGPPMSHMVVPKLKTSTEMKV